jgi:hypothetical protein
MYQVTVYSMLRGTIEGQRVFSTREAAIQALAALLRANGYVGTPAELSSELDAGREIEHGTRLYWLSELR